jgi:hypothetical protein
MLQNRRFLDLFYFLGHLPQGIVSGFCWCKTLQECLDAITLLLLRSCLSSCVAMLSNLLLSGVRNQCPLLQGLLFLLN